MAFWWRKARRGRDERQGLAPAALALLGQWDLLVELDGLMRVFRPDGRGPAYQLLLPKIVTKDVFTQVHQEHGHQGVEQILALLRSHCYWPGMSREVANWCKTCERCQIAEDSQPLARGFMSYLLASRPNEIVAIDFTLPEPIPSGLENVLVMTDVFSKYTLAVPTRDQRVSTVAQVLVTEWFAKFGVPVRLHSDC